MMMGTVANTPPAPPATGRSCGPNLESLTDIDVRKLSQSELLALSMCSDSAFDLHRTDDVVVPNIDRSIFHESAGSRRQSYSRIRDNRHHHLHRRTCLPGLLPGTKNSPALDSENHSILHFLKHYLENNSSSSCPPPPPPPPPIPPPQSVAVHVEPQDQSRSGLQEKLALALHAAEKKRKRFRQKAKQNKALQESRVGVELQRVNKKGQEVDFAALGSNGDELYSAELGKRTMGLQTEEKVLDFLRGIEGQWGSTRKRRKYVDANDFGDALPIGWKLLLGLRRRDGHVWLYCRRIVSPTGEQFLSCKEAASFLRSHFEARDSSQAVDMQQCQVEQALAMASVNVCYTHGSPLANITVPLGHEKEVFSMDIDDLPEVQVQDLFECYKCDVSFDKRNAYLQHLMSFHQQTTRKFKFGNTVGQNLIIKDSTLKCQFCQRVFLEKDSYDDHVEGHGPPTAGHVHKIMESTSEEVQYQTVGINSLTVVASNAPLSSAALDVSGPSILNSDETLADHPHRRATLISDPVELEELKADRTHDEGLLQHESECKVEDQKTMEVDCGQIFVTNLIETCQHDSYQSSAKYPEEYANKATEKGFGQMVCELSDGENVRQNESTPSPAPMMQPLEYLTSASDKGGNECFVDGQKAGNFTGFEELQLDEMDYDFVDENEKPETSSLPGLSLGLASDKMLGQGRTPAVGVEAQESQMNTSAAAHSFTTQCVWCSSEFKVEVSESDMQSDSVGYMCTTCKDSISGHLNRICSS